MSSHWPADWIFPQWPVAVNVRACVTTASQGASQGKFAHLNLGAHVGDDAAQVEQNRQLLADKLACTPVWLDQVHGIRVVEAQPGTVQQADASYSRAVGVACTILSADCLPVLFAAADGSCVAAAHAGWRSLLAGVLENTLLGMRLPAAQIQVWLGPAIGPQVYEVGADVRAAFIRQNAETAVAFVPSARDGHWLADLYRLARIRLGLCGVEQVYGGGFCTLTDKRFYSYRRQPVTGRFASLIWLVDADC